MQDQLGLDVEVISLMQDPIEICSNFSRIGLLDVSKTIQEADPPDYIGVLIPAGARSPALLPRGIRPLPRAKLDWVAAEKKHAKESEVKIIAQLQRRISSEDVAADPRLRGAR